MRKIKITPEIALQIKELWEKGIPSRDIQKQFDIGAAAISQHVRRNGIFRPHRISSRTLLTMQDGKFRCRKCLNYKTAAEYQINKCGNLISTCRDCRSRRELARRQANPDIWARVKIAAYKHRSEDSRFDIDADYMKWLYEKQSGKCFYSDYDLAWGYNPQDRWLATSVDKVIPSRGYTKGNVVLAQTRINSAKSDFTLDEMKKWMPDWYNRIVSCEWVNI